MKRKRSGKTTSTSVKRTKTSSKNTSSVDNSAPSPTILRLYYPRILTLRKYLAHACGGSKSKKRRVLNYGIGFMTKEYDHDSGLASLLDTVLIGCNLFQEEELVQDYGRKLREFSQQMSGSSAKTDVSDSGLSFSDIVDFSIWLMFRKHTSGHRPPHVLCHGYMHAGAGSTRILEDARTTAISGVISYSPNEHVASLKSEEWSGLPALMGKGGTRTLANLLTDCGIYVPLERGRNNYLQLSGVPLSDLRTLQQEHPPQGQEASKPKLELPNVTATAVKHAPRGKSHNSIRFVRHRMLYRKPNLNARGEASFGLSEIHVLNRIRKQDDGNTHLMKYIFPQQFGLHNAFTSDINPKETAQPFKDYTLREQEIRRVVLSGKKKSLPKKLRGECEALIGNLRKRHERCAYSALLRYYCPDTLPSQRPVNTTDENVLSVANSTSQVSAFCRAVVAKVFPGRLWGEGQVGDENRARIMHQIDRFVKLSRYESLMLHEVIQDVKITGIPWLRPPNEAPRAKMAASDFSKRKEILAELVYYLFDSFIMPLIGSNFHVTESASHRNRLFYFRHDVWKKLSEPALTTLKTSMFEELGQSHIKKTLSRRAIGTSRIRLLPKESGLRPIINLRRRVQTQINGRMVLGRSINSIMTPAFHVLNFEKTIMPEKLGSSMFSADDIYTRLQQFRAQLERSGSTDKPLYFAKVDVRSCFDTIPQKPLMNLLDNLLGSNEYRVTRHAEAKTLGDCSHSEEHAITPKVVWKFLGKAQAVNKTEPFSEYVEREATGKVGTVFVDSVVQNRETRTVVLSLIKEHIERNIVQIGRKYYRQKTGIPQGSIVSSLLCSFFYAELEKEVLGFVHDGNTVLLRLIDDFLLISTRHDVASRFIQIMHAGVPEYGLTIKSEKSKVNFDVQVNGKAVARLPSATDFPYCGNAINTVNLNITKDETRRQQNNLAAAVTVEYSRSPGQNFYRKSFNMLKLHMHAMHLCTRHNLVETVLANVFRVFADTAERCVHYIRSLPRTKQPSNILIITWADLRLDRHDRDWVLTIYDSRADLRMCGSFTETIDDLINVGYKLMQKKRDKNSDIQYVCTVSKMQTRWLACHAFGCSFGRRQTGFGGLLSWLRRQKAEAGLALLRDRHALEEIVRRVE